MEDYKVHVCYQGEDEEEDLPVMDECVTAFDGEEYGTAWWTGEEWKTSDIALCPKNIISWRNIESQE